MMQRCVCFLCLFLIFHSGIDAKAPSQFILESQEKIKTAQSTNEYSGLGDFFKNASITQKDLKHLKKVATSFHNTTIFQAAQFAESIELQKGDMPLTIGSLLHVALFIQTKLLDHIQKGTYFCSSTLTGGFAVEHDPITRQNFILLDSIKNSFLGKGANKIARKTILFHPTQPEIIVRSEQSRKPITRELGFTKRVHGMPGVMVTRAFTERTSDGITYGTIYSNLYNQSSLLSMFTKKFSFTFKQKLKIAEGLLTGLSSLHKLGIIHRDIKAGNCLVDITKIKNGKEKVEGVLTDYGSTVDVAHVFHEAANAVLTNTSPEGIFYTKLEGADYYKTDIFALGTVLYRLYYGVTPPWKDRKYYTIDPNLFVEKYDLLVAKINQVTKKRREEIEMKQAKKNLTEEEALELVILSMLHPDPKLRGTAEEHRNKLVLLAKRPPERSKESL